MISIQKLLVEQIVHDLSPDFFSVVDIVLDFGLVIKSEEHPEMFTFVHDFWAELFGGSWFELGDDAFLCEKITWFLSVEVQNLLSVK